jgi:predicted GIY-YIG superfamily endonuclease
MSSKNIVYLLHFERRICASRTTQHYIGWTNNLDDRLWNHSRGKGSRLCAVARQRNIRFVLAECWIGDRALERRLKRYKNAPRLCPICYPAGSKKLRQFPTKRSNAEMTHRFALTSSKTPETATVNIGAAGITTEEEQEYIEFMEEHLRQGFGIIWNLLKTDIECEVTRIDPALQDALTN